MTENKLERENKKELLKYLWERENYTHGIIWKAENFFAVLISGLIAVAISLLSFNVLATFTVIIIAFAMTLLGDYVLRKESQYFMEFRYDRIKLQRDLNYHKGYEDVINEFKGEFPPKKEYLKKRTMPKKGVRYAFTLIYLFQAILCMVIILALTLGEMAKLVSFDWMVLNLKEVTQSVIGFVLLVIMIIFIIWYRMRTGLKSEKTSM